MSKYNNENISSTCVTSVITPYGVQQIAHSLWSVFFLKGPLAEDSIIQQTHYFIDAQLVIDSAHISENIKPQHVPLRTLPLRNIELELGIHLVILGYEYLEQSKS